MEPKHDLAKWLSGEMTDAEQSAFEQSEEFATYDRIARATARMKAPDFNEDERLSEIYASEKTTTTPVRQLRPMHWIYAAAAILVIALGVFALYPKTEIVNVIAENGSRSEVSLPDASVVTLNSGSKISYNASDWNTDRSVELDGEAFFKVAKGEKFDVVTTLGTVTVMGTQFNVKERDERFEVSCFEGKVRVVSGENQTILTPGMLVVYENGALIPSKPETESRPGWMDHQLHFHSADLSEITKELERIYNIQISSSNSVKEATFTGLLPSDNLEKALEILCKTYSLNARTVQNKVVLSGNE